MSRGVTKGRGRATSASISNNISSGTATFEQKQGDC